MDEPSPNSDVEIEAALTSNIELDQQDGHSTVSPSIPTINQPVPLTTSMLPPKPDFQAPSNPSMPQDLSLIMEMVASHQVVGSLPPLSMTAAEKRKLVEESMKGEGKTIEPSNGGAKEDDTDSESDSDSSDSDSDSESDADGPETQGKSSGAGGTEIQGMTAEKHAAMKIELDKFMLGPQGEDSWEEGHITEDSDEDEEEEADFQPTGARAIPLMMEMEDDEEAGAISGPILSTHEVPLPPVQLPPLEKLPEGEGVSLAGDVVSWMKDKKVEGWVEKEASLVESQKKPEEETKGPEALDEGRHIIPPAEVSTESHEEGLVTDETIDLVPGPSTNNELVTATAESPKSTKTTPRFTSAGTVVVRAMQSRPGASDEGWLEEGSVVCWEDGRVLGTVSETFGPLTSPFYQIRLPPPPFPYPSPSSLTAGTRLYYPTNPVHRSFVNTHQLRTDPRFKGSDASNIYDEEVGEDEREWSDDEMEAEAKRRRKQSKRGGSRAGSSTPWSDRGTPGPSRLSGIPGLPERPHFDYAPSAASESGSVMGDDEALDYDGVGDEWEGSDYSSTAGGKGRAMPAPYEDAEMALAGQDTGVRSTNQAQSREGRGRGGGRERGRGRGGDRGRGGRGRGGNDKRGGRPPQSPQPPPQNFSLPRNPALAFPQSIPQIPTPPQQQYQYQQPQQPYFPPPPPHQYQSQQYQQQPQGHSRPPQYNNGYPSVPYQQQNFQAPQYPQPPPPFHQQNSEGYNPTQPSTGLGMMNPGYPQPPQNFGNGYNPYPPAPQQYHQQIPPANGNAPAINPRFAAQYQQMMMNGGFPGGQGQGQGQGQGFPSQFSE